MDIYLDNSATTRVAPEIIEKMSQWMTEDYGNPSSLHRLGVESEKKIKKARKAVAKLLGVKDKEIIFTSGGTESNNLAIQGILNQNSKKGKIITTRVEHPSVLNTIRTFEKLGYEIVYMKVDSQGHLNIDEFKELLDEDTQLVSVMHVNNETGIVHPIELIGQWIHQFNLEHQTQIRFHVDAVQSYGKIKVPVKKAFIDLVSLSGHKIHALKGTGALYIREGVSIKPLVYGGGQERELRVGTENFYGILALGEASKIAEEEMKDSFDRVKMMKTKMVEHFIQEPSLSINGSSDFPYILNVSFLGTKGEVLLHALEMEKIYVSTGSACSSKKKSYSSVLEAMGLDVAHKDAAIRISFGKYNTLEEIEMASKIIIKTAQQLQKIMGKRK